MKNKKVSIFRLPYPYGKSQIYLPTDLLLVASRLKNVGIEAIVHDLNLHHLLSLSNFEEQDAFGIGVFGTPYILGAMHLAQTLSFKSNKPVMVGGQVIEKLPEEHFDKIFGDTATQVRGDQDLTSLLEISPSALPSPYETPITPVLRDLSSTDLRNYLSREFSLFVAQGCMFACDFCAAEKKQPERYRDLSVIEEEVRELTTRAKSFGLERLAIYLSSLDLFQSPEPLARTLDIFARQSRDSGVQYSLRGLARVDSFLKALEHAPELERLIAESGVNTIGFGVDGTTEKIWRSQHKGHKDLSEVDRALDKCKDVGITPELLMVMGFPEDTLGSVTKNYLYTVARAYTHGAVSRPYVAKQFVPGNEGWCNPLYAEGVRTMVENPEMLVNNDFATLGSPLTHPRRFHRYISNLAYLGVIATLEPFGRNATYPLLPRAQGTGFLARTQNKIVDKINKRIPFDK